MVVDSRHASQARALHSAKTCLLRMLQFAPAERFLFFSLLVSLARSLTHSLTRSNSLLVARLCARSWWGSIVDTLSEMNLRDEALRTLGPRARAFLYVPAHRRRVEESGTCALLLFCKLCVCAVGRSAPRSMWRGLVPQRRSARARSWRPLRLPPVPPWERPQRHRRRRTSGLSR